MKKIEDIYFAAALLAYGAELHKIDREDTRHQKFLFRPEDITVYILDDGVFRKDAVTLDRAEALHLSSKLLYPPTYPDCIRKIKAIIYS
jgi:hypothetical protein